MKETVPLEQAYSRVLDGLRQGRMLVLVGECHTRYHGRARASLGPGDRVVIVKRDGTLLVHQKEKLAPVNYQPPGTVIRVAIENGALRISGQRGKEILDVVFSRIDHLLVLSLEDKSEISVYGMEKDLSRMLKNNLSLIEDGLSLLRTERPLVSGNIDILARDRDGNIVVIEVKRRRAGLPEATQLIRYVREARRNTSATGKKVRGILVAPSITQNAKKLLDREGLEYRRLDLDADEIKKIESRQEGLDRFA